MLINLPQNVIEWTNKNWEELEIPLESVEYRVVDSLPFGSDAHAMTWRGKVLVRRGWIESALRDIGPNNTLNPRHLWAIETLAFHEPWHVQKQRETNWIWYLIKYVLAWAFRGGYRNIPEEKTAYGFERRLSGRFFDEVGKYIEGWRR